MRSEIGIKYRPLSKSPFPTSIQDYVDFFIKGHEDETEESD